MILYKKFIDELVEKIERHKKVSDVGVGRFDSISDRKYTTYPLVFLQPGDIIYDGSLLTRTFTLFVLDQSDRQQNLVDVLCGCESIMLDIILYLDQYYVVRRVGNIEPINENYDSLLSGWMCGLEFEFTNDIDQCNLPFDDDDFEVIVPPVVVPPVVPPIEPPPVVPPEQDDELVLWFAPDSIVDDGLRVTSWDDKSGRGKNLINMNSGYRPVVVGGFGGYDVVRFDGVNDNLYLDDHGLDSGDNMTCYIVFRGYGCLFDTHIDTVNGLSCGGDINGVGWFRYGNGGMYPGTYTSTGVTNDIYHVGVYRQNSVARYIHIDGYIWSGETRGLEFEYPIYKRLNLGVEVGSATFWKGDIVEFKLYRGDHSIDEVWLNEGRLAWKYGLEGNLVDDHIYKNEEPE